MIPKRIRKLVLSFGVLGFLFVTLLGFGVWSLFNSIEESVTGIGEVVPSGRVRRVMAPVNGEVVTVKVRENQRVKKGQLLIELDPEFTEVEKTGFTEQLDNLENQVKALEGAYTGQSADFSASDYGSVQANWLRASQEASKAKLTSARMQIQKNEHLYQEVVARQEKTQSLLESSQAMLAKYQKLHEKGGLPKKDLIEYQQRVTEREGELAALSQEVEARAIELEQSRQQPQMIQGDYRKELLGSLSQVKQSMTELATNRDKVRLTMERQTITAPMDGVIYELQVHGPGEVVTAGSVLLVVVPVGSELVAEVKVTNQDLAYIHLNQSARLEIEALPYQQFGKLHGIVEGISPSTVKDEQGRPFYLVRIRPDRHLFQKDGKTYPLRSGMTLTAQIITRHKNLISFLTEPITNHLDKAFRDPSKY